MIADRDIMLRGFAKVLDEDDLATFDELVPKKRWREVLPSGLWSHPDVAAYVDTPGRRHLYIKLVELLGAEAADVTLEYLPPVPWSVLRARGVSHLLH